MDFGSHAISHRRGRGRGTTCAARQGRVQESRATQGAIASICKDRTGYRFIPKYDYRYYLATPYPEYKIESVREERRGGDFDVMVDRKPVGHVAPGKPLTVVLPAGAHRLHFEGGGVFGLFGNRVTPREETSITVSPGKTSYFYAPLNASSIMLPAELDAVTAKAVIDGVEPKVNGIATIYIYWPGGLLDIDFLKSDFDFFVDEQPIGTMTSGEYIMAKVPAGKRLLQKRSRGFLAGPPFFQPVILGAGITHHYLLREETRGTGKFVYKVKEFFQLTAEQVNPDLKSLRQR